jgi:hypothetical protein
MGKMNFSFAFAIALCTVTVVTASETPLSSSQKGLGKLKGEILDADTGRGVHARVYVADSAGNRYFDPRGVIFKHSRDNEQDFSCAGKFQVEIPPGHVAVRIERGLEYVPLVKTVKIASEAVHQEKFLLKRWVNMAERGWYSGDLHGHRAPEEMETLVLAEDINIASVITRHNQRDYWQGKKIPQDFLIRVDDAHFITQFDEEVEYLGKDTLGALVFVGVKKPFVIADSTVAYPTLAQYADICHHAEGVVDAEKPIWLGVAISAALGQIDTVGIVNNHFHPHSVLPCVGRWGELVPEKGFEGNEGLALWCMELYYRLLNCGFRIPVSAGTASGIMPSPVGYGRVYVRVPGQFSYEKWVEGLKAGRSFATNGPILFMRVGEHQPGDLIKIGGPGGEVSVEVQVESLHPLAYLEIVASGKVIARADAPVGTNVLRLNTSLALAESAWVVARAFERNAETAKFAHTSPVYIEVAGKPVLSSKAAAYYKSNIERVIAFTAASKLFKNEQDRQTALSIYRKARDIYAQIEKGALAPQR